MKRNLPVLFLLFILPFLAQAQEHQWSALYFNNGKLRADTTLSISAEQFKVWRRAEESIVAAIAYNLMYPAVCLRNGVEGHVVVAFDFTGTEVKNIKTISTANSYFNEAAIHAIQSSAKIIIAELASRKHLNNRKGVYYVPIDFELLDIREEVKKRGAIPIIKPSEPMVPATIFGIP